MPTLLSYILLFVLVGVGFILLNLLVGKLVRPNKPDVEKATIYECGEPTVGTAWIQFDLRFYVIALLFVIFDVDLVLFFPWAVVYGKLNALGDPATQQLSAAQHDVLVQSLVPGAPPGTLVNPESANLLAWLALIDILVFFGVLLVGFAYLWRRGDLNWIRSTAAEQPMAEPPPPTVSLASTPPTLAELTA